MDASSKQAVDFVNHPPHYQTKNGLETIDVIEAFTEDLTGAEAIHTGNVIKYICRWKHKNGLEDLKKARWYLNRLIIHEEKKRMESDNQTLCCVSSSGSDATYGNVVTTACN